ncbi:MAG: hypothetical protein ACW98K_03105 [Candidatus Kariarchaeaceae archaeon]|jgi:hypothetical protein
MWEWRVFHEITVFNLEQQLQKYSDEAAMRFHNTQIETRVDYYLDLKVHKYGLKERWDEISGIFFPRFEVKIREKRDEQSGCEWWESVINVPIEGTIDTGLAIDQVLGILNSSEFQKKKGLLNKIAQIQPHRIGVHKERRQLRAKFDKKKDKWTFHSREDYANFSLDDSVLIEQTKINKIQNRKYTLQTISCEASNIEIIEKFKKTFIRLTNEQPMGYPGFLIFLLS